MNSNIHLTLSAHLACLLLALSTQTVQAADAPLCRPFEELLPPAPKSVARVSTGEEVRILADDALVEETSDIALFRGKVTIQRGHSLVHADELVYRRQSGEMEARGGVTLWDRRFVIRGERAELGEDDSGGIEEAQYWLRERRGYGKAERMLRYDEDRSVLLDMDFTTCDPDNQTWRLDARETKLNFATDTGISRGVVLRVHDWPVLYTPYLNYPLSDKPKSGLLVPRVGHSGELGFDLALPYYWHAASSYDFTFTPRWMSRRGLMLGTEFRYLTGRSDGQWDFEYLPEDLEYDAHRSFLRVFHKTQLSPVLNAQVNYEETSDHEYFEHFGNSLDLAGTLHLQRRAAVNYLLPNYYLLQGYVLDYQSLQDPALPKPYRVLPALTLRPLVPPRNRRLNLLWQMEAKRFELTDDTDRPQATRLHFAPRLVYPLRFAAGFVEPGVELAYTYYAKEDTLAGEDSTQDRFSHTFSLDNGLFFEREFAWQDKDLLQTLEPRLFYQYSPQQDQEKYPLFDTARYDLSWGQLFRTEPFSGRDRASDYHTVSAGLRSRVLERSDGDELLQAGLGRRFFVRDSKIVLPGETSERAEASPYVAEAAISPRKHLRLSHTSQWEPEQGRSLYSAWRMRYHTAVDKLLNVGYRQRDERLRLEQTDVSWYWPLNPRWHSLGRWNYSLEHSANLEVLAGFEYESCCWALRLVARRYLQDLAEDDYETSFHFQIQLKGLGGLGSSAFLRERIAGFDESF